MFSVKSSYDLYEGGRQHLVHVKMIWNPIVPTKVGFFVWEVWWGKILTMNQLKKHGFSLTSRCPFVGRRKKLWSFFSFIALRFGTCGLLCFPCLMADGFVPTWFKICFWAGFGSLSRKKKQSCGGHFPCTCCGQSGWK